MIVALGLLRRLGARRTDGSVRGARSGHGQIAQRTLDVDGRLGCVHLAETVIEFRQAETTFRGVLPEFGDDPLALGVRRPAREAVLRRGLLLEAHLVSMAQRDSLLQ